MMYYFATNKNNKTLEAEAIFKVDSGQYYEGTTDITRTIALGPVEEK